MKKILCVLLSVLCMFSLLGTMSFADTECAHNYETVQVAPTCAEKGYTLHVCTKCGDNFTDSYTNALGHNYGSWSVINDSTCTEEGHRERECVRCHSKETETLSVLAHVDADADGECDKCGAPVEVKKIFSPFDWFVAFFKAVIEWFRVIFA